MLTHSIRPQICALLGCLVLAFSCAGTPVKKVELPYPAIESGSFGEINNISRMGPIWFGAMPCGSDLDLASRRGVQRLVDLSIPPEKGDCSLSVTCQRLGIEFLSAGIRPEGVPSDEAVDLVMGWLADSLVLAADLTGDSLPKQKSTLVVDGSGGRSATFLAIFRTVSLGVPLGVALDEARRGGMLPGAPEDFVRSQVERLKATALAISAEALAVGPTSN
jgi:hypothetical protein